MKNNTYYFRPFNDNDYDKSKNLSVEELQSYLNSKKTCYFNVLNKEYYKDYVHKMIKEFCFIDFNQFKKKKNIFYGKKNITFDNENAFNIIINHVIDNDLFMLAKNVIEGLNDILLKEPKYILLNNYNF